MRRLRIAAAVGVLWAAADCLPDEDAEVAEQEQATPTAVPGIGSGTTTIGSLEIALDSFGPFDAAAAVETMTLPKGARANPAPNVMVI